MKETTASTAMAVRICRLRSFEFARMRHLAAPPAGGHLAPVLSLSTLSSGPSVASATSGTATAAVDFGFLD